MLANHSGLNWCLIMLGSILLPFLFLGLSYVVTEEWRERLVRRAASDKQLELAFEYVNLAAYVIFFAAGLAASWFGWYKTPAQAITFYVVYCLLSLWVICTLAVSWVEERKSWAHKNG